MRTFRIKNLLFTLVIISVLSLFITKATSIGKSFPRPAAEEIKIIKVEPFVYCSLSRVGSFSEIESMVGELMQHLQNQNVFPTGPMIGIFHGQAGVSDPESLRWEIGFPVNEQAQVLAPLEKKLWNYTTVAMAIYQGPYDKTGETILKIQEWLEENGYQQVGPVMERYLDPDPSRTSPQRLKTEIWVPCEASID